MARPGKSSPILGAVTSIIGEASETLVTNGSRFRHSFEISLDAVNPDPEQPRKQFGIMDIEGLATTMAEQGQLQPILVRRDPVARGHWIIVAGERRWRAARHNAWVSILAIEHLGDPEVAALIENLQRVDLQPVEEARGLQRLIEDKGWSQDRAAAALGKTKSEISAVLRILTLPASILETAGASDLAMSKNVLIELARLDDPETLELMTRLARTEGLTVRRIRQARDQTQHRRDYSTTSTPRLSVTKIEMVTQLLQSMCNENNGLQDAERIALQALRDAANALLENKRRHL